MGAQVSDAFSQRVSMLMKQRFLTKKDMAKRLNVDYSTFWRKLNGKRNVDITLLTKVADILGTSTAYLMGETNNPNRDANIPSSVSKEQDIVPRSEAPISYAYWGDVTDKARDVAVSGDEDTIAYVTQMLRRALSLLACKTVSVGQSASHERTRVTNTPFMIGEHNENNLTVSPVH